MSTNKTVPTETEWWDDIAAWPTLETHEDGSSHDEWGWLDELPTADNAARSAAPVPGKGRNWPQPRRRALVTVGALASVAVVTAGVVMLTSSSSEDHQPPVATATPSVPVTGTTAPSASSTTPVDDCPSTSKAGVVTGNDRGHQLSGPGVIKAFDYAYYTRRSAVEAVAVTATSARLNSLSMQTFIDKLPRGTGYCLSITDRGSGLYAVKLTETTPGKPPTVYRQLIETTRANGKTWIAAIRTDKSTR
ncbi:hypothetical protein [uncultured Gordonia sp.]|uniref:hypothetical protein n=1 Tax=uncultured Gordonia sp. TaxID=198437 RepID=UPI002632F470|nr:hypothetical protein [uncultured Gordonia sp.]